MIKIDHVVLASPDQMEFIIEGIHNPTNSWNKSDSVKYCSKAHDEKIETPGYEVGEEDLNLRKRLAAAGADHRKFLRMMPVYVRITAPLHWWEEFDTYKVGTVSNSCSTIHKIHEKEFTLEDFSCEHLINSPLIESEPGSPELLNMQAKNMLEIIIGVLNAARENYLKTKDKKYWWQIIQLLPSSYNQTRNVMMNYEVLANMYHARKDHKLDEWREFCKWIEELPCSELIVGRFELPLSPLLEPKYKEG